MEEIQCPNCSRVWLPRILPPGPLKCSACQWWRRKGKVWLVPGRTGPIGPEALIGIELAEERIRELEEEIRGLKSGDTD